MEQDRKAAIAIAAQAEAIANARLIAAAPALYEALKATCCRKSRYHQCKSNEDMCDRCAAIELAEKGDEKVESHSATSEQKGAITKGFLKMRRIDRGHSPQRKE